VVLEPEEIVLQLLVGVVAELLDRLVLDRMVHALRLPIGPGVAELRRLVPDAIPLAETVERVCLPRGLERWRESPVGELQPVVRQDAVDLIGDEPEEEREEPRALSRGLRPGHEETDELRDPVDPDEEISATPVPRELWQVRGVHMEEPWEVRPELASPDEFLRESLELVLDERPVAVHPIDLREVWMQGCHQIIKGEFQVRADLRDDPLLEFREGPVDRLRPRRMILNLHSVPPLHDGLDVQVELTGKRPITGGTLLDEGSDMAVRCCSLMVSHDWYDRTIMS